MRDIIQNKEQIILVYKQTGSTKETAKLLSIKQARVQYVVKKAGILKGMSDSRKKYYYNEHYFDCIDSEHKAYWLGVLCADGCVCYEDVTPRLQLALSAIDKDYLQLFLNDLQSDAPLNIHTKKSGKYKGTKNVGVYIRSKHLCDTLERLGCTRRKSKTLVFPDYLPDNLIPHFIRGYFDGDGCVFISKEKHWRHGTVMDVLHFRFIGTFDVITKIDSYLGLNGRISCRHSKLNSNIFELAYKRRRKAVLFYQYLYANSTIYLSRKKQIFDLHLKKDVQRL